MMGMTGTYFTPDPKRSKHHRCLTPMASSYAGRPAEPRDIAGTHWRCECGKAYVVVQESEHNETWTVWKRIPEYDKVPDA